MFRMQVLLSIIDPMKKREILFLTTELPFPPISGGTIKSFNFLKHLGSIYSVHLASLIKRNSAEKSISELRSRIPLSSVHLQKLKVDRSGGNLIKSYFYSDSFNSYRNKSTAFGKQVRKIAPEVDAIIIDHYEMFQYIPSAFHGKLIYHSHNAEFLLWQRMASLGQNPLKRAILWLESKRVKKLEKKIISEVDLFFATPHDIGIFKKNGMNCKRFASTFHLGDDRILEREKLLFSEAEESIMFLGTLSWEPNINGLIWFFENVWPIIQEKHQNLKIYVIGSNADQRLLKFQEQQRVEFTGFVEDVEEYYRRCRLSFVPLQFGSGMKVKVLEAMYRGLPMVLTPVAAEGIDLVDGDNAFIADQPKEFAEKLMLLLNDEGKWNQFSESTRKLARQKYTWKLLFQAMDVELEKVLE